MGLSAMINSAVRLAWIGIASFPICNMPPGMTITLATTIRVLTVGLKISEPLISRLSSLTLLCVV